MRWGEPKKERECARAAADMGNCMSSRPKKVASRADYIQYMARTGDFWLFSSNSLEIKCFTGSPYTHIGQILVLDPAIFGGSGVYLWHSMPPGDHYPLDLLSSPPRRKEGPQLNDVREVLKRWGDVPVDVRRIRFKEGSSHPWLSEEPIATAPLIRFMRREHVKPYETNFAEFVKSAYDGPGGQNEEDTSEYFCSELVAETYKRFGVMNTPQPSNEFVPGDFSSDRDYCCGFRSNIRFKGELRIV